MHITQLLLRSGSLALLSQQTTAAFIPSLLGSLDSPLEKRCSNPCGYYGQLCCAADEVCYTDANNQAQCGAASAGSAAATTAAQNGYYTFWTTTFLQTDYSTVTSTMSSFVAVQTAATTTTVVAGCDTCNTGCQYSLGETPCGSTCCKSGFWCQQENMCVAVNGVSTLASSLQTVTTVVTNTASAAARPTSNVIITVTSTGTAGTVYTTTQAFGVPVSTGTSGVIVTSGDGGGGGLSGGAIAGIVIGVIAGIILLLLLCACCLMRGLLDGLLAIFGMGHNRTRRRTEEVDVYESRHHYSGGAAGGRTWFGARPTTTTRIEEKKKKDSSGLAKFAGAGAFLGALALILGLKRRHDERRDSKSDVSYGSSYYSYDYDTSIESESDRGQRRSQRSSRSQRADWADRPSFSGRELRERKSINEAGSPGADSQLSEENRRVLQWVADLMEPARRESALMELSKKREQVPELALVLWYSFGVMTSLLQEIISVYPLLNPSQLTAAASNRVCNALALLQCVASHNETRGLFLNAHIPLFLYPFLNTTSKSRPFEYLRLTSLGVIGALVKNEPSSTVGVNNNGNGNNGVAGQPQQSNSSPTITFLLTTEIIPLCLRIMETGSELSKTVAIFIVQKILLDDTGLGYICATYERFYAVGTVLSNMVAGLVETQTVRLLKHVVRCFLRLSDNNRARQALRQCLPEPLRDATFSNVLRDDAATKRCLAQLLINLSDTVTDAQADQFEQALTTPFSTNEEHLIKPTNSYPLKYSKQLTTLKLVDKPIGPIGFGLMGLTWRKEPPSQEQAFDTLKAALEAGANFWNGGEMYGSIDRHSGHLLAEYFRKYPEDADKIVLSIKGGLEKDRLVPNGTETNIRRSVNDVLATLEGTNVKIDIFESARVDHNVPVEDSVRVLKTLHQDEGKIGGIGLSEVRASTITRAATAIAPTPIAAVEVELSLWNTDILRNGVAATAARLGIPIVAYSPLGRGALAGDKLITSTNDLPEHDVRRHYPQFQDDALAQNNRLVQEVAALAKRKGVTKAQVAIAWVRQQSGREVSDGQGGTVKLGTIIPIPGATTRARVLENSKLVELTEEELLELDEIVKRNPIKGTRYPAEVSSHLEG
ncbi:hypothetical protein DV738_g3203, partial [Chaetothyriales sp. CBS 135597]